MASAQKYWAFLSYSHEDAAVADWVHQALETYRVPPSLVGRQIGSINVPGRLFPTFRDRTELSAASDLYARLKGALADSHSLIVLCSPGSKQSEWVNKEIKFFKQFAPARPIVPLLVRGEPGDAFPHELVERITQAGAAEVSYPLAIDLRPGKEPAADVQLRLISAILGLPLDELRGRDRLRRHGQMLHVANELLERDADLSTCLAIKVARSAEDWNERGVRLLAEAALYGAVCRLRHIRSFVQPGTALGLAFSPDGNRLISARGSGILQLIDTSEYAVLGQLALSGPAYHVGFNASGTRIVAASDGLVYVLDATQGLRELVRYSATGHIVFCEFIGAADTVVATTEAGDLYCWPASTEGAPHRAQHGREIRCVAANDDRSMLATCSRHSIRVWRTSNLRLLAELPLNGLALGIAFNADSSRLAAAMRDWTVRVWDLPNWSRANWLSLLGRRLFPSTLPSICLQAHSAPVVTCAFERDGAGLITVSRDNTARLWDPRLPDEPPKVLEGEGQTLTLRPGEVAGWFAKIERKADWSVEEKTRATQFIDEGGMAETGGVQADRARAFALVEAFLELNGLESWYAANGAISDGALSSNGKLLAKPSKDRSVSLFEVGSGKKVAVLHGHQTRVRSLAFSPDSQFLASGSEDGVVHLWNCGDQRKDLEKSLAESSPILRYVLNHDRSGVLTLLESGGFTVWKLPTGERAVHYDTGDHVPVCGAFSSDGSLVAIGDEDGRLKIVSVDSGQVIFEKKEDLIVNDFASLLAKYKDRDSLPKNDFTDRVIRRIDQHKKADWGEEYSPGFREIALLWGEPAVAAYGSKHLYLYRYDGSNAGSRLQIVAKEESATAYLICPRRGELLIAIKSRRLELWDIRSMKRTTFVELQDDVTTLSAHYERDVVGIGCGSGTAYVWCPRDGRTTALKGHRGEIKDVRFSGQGERIATSSSDGTAAIWSTDSGALLVQFREHRAGSTSSVISPSFSPSGRTIATCGADKAIRLWSTESGEQLAMLPLGDDGRCSMLSDNTVLAAKSEELRLFNHLPGGTTLVDLAERSLAMAVSPDEIDHLIDQNGQLSDTQQFASPGRFPERVLPADPDH